MSLFGKSFKIENRIVLDSNSFVVPLNHAFPDTLLFICLWKIITLADLHVLIYTKLYSIFTIDSILFLSV